MHDGFLKIWYFNFNFKDFKNHLSLQPCIQKKNITTKQQTENIKFTDVIIQLGLLKCLYSVIAIFLKELNYLFIALIKMYLTKKKKFEV